MASISPVTSGTTGFVEPLGKMFHNKLDEGDTATTDATLIVDEKNLKLSIYGFATFADGDVWDSASTDPPPPGLVDIAWQGNATATDYVVPHITSVGYDGPSAVRVDAIAGAKNGWLWCFHT